MKRQRILITGSSGLIGSALREALEIAGHHVTGLDLRAGGDEAGDVCDRARVRDAVQGCDGVVHLAAVSRVVWAQRDPGRCWRTNVSGIANVIAAAEALPTRPWLVFASSREVYGDVAGPPVSEDAPLCPVNVYARSKVEGEALVAQAARRGLRTATVRLSNVYGRTADHADRVMPAFARAAAFGEALRVEGSDNLFDFTHVDDVVPGLLRVVDRLTGDRAAALPPIHFVSGQAQTLGQLAELANRLGGGRSPIVGAPPRHFDVAHFHGCGSRARALLDWAPQITVPIGLARLIAEFRHDARIVATSTGGPAATCAANADLYRV
jgi:nucleoside-diphosphate-sugar epimerase